MKKLINGKVKLTLPEEVEFIQTISVDINGIGRGKMFPIEKLQDLFKNTEEVVGLMEVYGTKCEIPYSIQEIAENKFENEIIVLDRESLRVSPWSNDKSLAMVFYDLYDRKLNVPWPFNPRLLAKQKIKELDEMGYKLFIGVENEFWLLNKETKIPLTKDIRDSEHFTQVTKALPFVKRLRLQMQKIDIAMDSWNMENGIGQIEIPLVPYCDMDAVDNVWLFREMAKYTADDMGMIASFMTLPFANSCGSGMHINHSLWRKEEQGLMNAMRSNSGDGKLSEIGQQWLAGVMTHSRALTAIFCPTVNCYRRIQAGDFAPNVNAWNYRDRTLAYRVKTSQINEKVNYIEVRVPSSASNIYITVSALIVAGLDGIIKKMKLQPPCKGSHCEKLPKSLAEALEELQNDKVLKQGLGEKFVEWFIKSKTETDVDVFKDIDLSIKTVASMAQEVDKYLHL